MSFMDEIKRLARPYSEDEDDFDEEEEYEDEEEEEEEEEEEPAPRRTARASAARPTASARPAAQSAPRPVTPAYTASSATASAASSGIGGIRSGSLKMILVKPERYEDVSSVADELRARNAVVLNLENTNSDTARRLVDFLSGAAYAMQGNIRKVATSTYIITPQNVDIEGELKPEDIENTTISYD